MKDNDVQNICIILSGLVPGTNCHQPEKVTADQVAYAVCLYKQVVKQTADVKPEAETTAALIAAAVEAALAARDAAPAPAPAPEPAPPAPPAPEGGGV